ncbi:unnamed protein product [Acanthosepion pharaonis]|uniref:Uncharacterized protein n=1 Tax=Acanthosepion pharaonis TaxID=158019 RepID=A0A812CL18_ACAPH|nr:unnamed protein product [Sepia pharaonis]
MHKCTLGNMLALRLCALALADVIPVIISGIDVRAVTRLFQPICFLLFCSLLAHFIWRKSSFGLMVKGESALKMWRPTNAPSKKPTFKFPQSSISNRFRSTALKKEVKVETKKAQREIVSSDTQIERNALMVDTYPKIQEFCANLGLDFQVIDMRWGIPDESQLDHSMEELCLSEIKNCQNLSLGPNFVPVRSVYPNYMSRNCKLKEQSEKDILAWQECEMRLQDVLRKAATSAYHNNSLTKEQLHQFYLSVTESEMTKGILKAKNADSKCLIYLRKFTNFPDSLDGDDLNEGSGEEMNMVDDSPALYVDYVIVNKKTMCLLRSNLAMIASGSSVLLWDIPTGKCDQAIAKTVFRKAMFMRADWMENCTGTSTIIVRSPNHKFIVIGSEDGYVLLYRTDNGMPIQMKAPDTKHEAPVCQVAVSPNNKWVSSFCVNNFLKLWSACNNEEHFSIQLRSQAVKLQFTLDSKHLAVLSEKSNVCIFKVHEGKTFNG